MTAIDFTSLQSWGEAIYRISADLDGPCNGDTSWSSSPFVLLMLPCNDIVEKQYKSLPQEIFRTLLLRPPQMPKYPTVRTRRRMQSGFDSVVRAIPTADHVNTTHKEINNDLQLLATHLSGICVGGLAYLIT